MVSLDLITSSLSDGWRCIDSCIFKRKCSVTAGDSALYNIYIYIILYCFSIFKHLKHSNQKANFFAKTWRCFFPCVSIPLPLTIMIGAVCSAKTGRPHTKLEFAAHPPWHKNTKAQALETLQFSSIRDWILLIESLGTRTRCDKCLEKPEDGFGLILASLRFYRFETL